MMGEGVPLAFLAGACVGFVLGVLIGWIKDRTDD